MNISGDGSPKGTTMRSARVAGVVGGNWAIGGGNCGSITFASSAEVFEAVIPGAVGTIRAAGNKKTAVPSVLSGTWEFGSVKIITAADIKQCDITAVQPAKEDKPAIGKITAKGWINDCNVTAAAGGDISSISAGAIKDCNFSTNSSLGEIENKGITNEAFCFINSKITARHIKTAYLGYPKYINIVDGNNETFGLTAKKIDKLTIKDSTNRQAWTNDEIGIDGIAIGDLKINLQK
jgi:hypothetical protein